MARIPAGLALLLVVGATVLGLFGRFEAKKNAARQAWASTTGTITGCDYIPFQSQGDSRQQQSLRTGYAYVVAGRPYDITIVQWAHYGISSATPICKGQVPIYFNPDDPHDASLTHEGPPTTLLFVLSIGLALLSVPFWYLAFRWARKAAPAS